VLVFAGRRQCFAQDPPGPQDQRPAFALATTKAGEGAATAGVVKDAGDDPDVTHGALILAEGKLSFNPDVVWVDVWAFEHALDATPPDVDAALALYRGHFLGLETPAPWAMPLRDRLQARLSRAVLARGQALEAQQDFAAARLLYERALDLDNLAEPVYRRLMVCQRELGDPAGALSTYRRCRELLSIVLGRQPTAETEAVRASLVTA